MNAQLNRRDFIKRASLVPPCAVTGMGLGNVPAFGAEAIKRCGGPMLKVGLNAYLFALSLPEIPSAWDLLSFQQVGDRLLPNDDLVGQRSPGNLYVGTAVSLGTGIRAPGALAPGDGHAAIATQATVQRC